jgi:hypothetical protein
MSEPVNPNNGEFLPPFEEDPVPLEDSSPPPPTDPGNDKKWIVPVLALGCGCICAPLIAIALGLFGLGNTARRLYQSTGTYQVYQLASEEVETDAEVVDVLGSPVEAGWTTQSREAYENGTGIVCMRFNVIGGDRSGSAYAEAQQHGGAWKLYQISLLVNDPTAPVEIVLQPPEGQPLCPNFDDPDAPAKTPGPEDDEVLPGTGTEI